MAAIVARPKLGASTIRSGRAFTQLLDNSLSELSACWTSIRPDPDPARMDLFAFQPRLLRTLQRLELEFLALAAQKRNLIRRKERVAPGWFRVRMRLCSERQEALRDAQIVGRAMGDSFAWLLYREEQRLLDEHAAQQFIVPIPTGIGGQGELAFISSQARFAGLFVLHHGITTILRLGDISLIDVARNRVVAIGELKTRRANDEEVEIDVMLISPKGERINQAHIPVHEASRGKLLQRLNPAMQSRLRRQLMRTAKALRPEEVPKQVQLTGVPGATYAEELAKAVQEARRGKWITHQAGPGLLYIVYRSLSSSFEGRLREMTTTAPRRLASGKNPSEAIVPLIVPSSAHNAVVTGAILYGANGRPHLTRQAMPLVWLGVDHELVRRILTLDTQVIYVYNPAHLYAAFARRGWEVEKSGPPPEVVLSRRKGRKVQRLHGMDWFLRDVTLGLRSEEQVASAVDAGTRALRRYAKSDRLRATLNIRHMMPAIVEEQSHE